MWREQFVCSKQRIPQAWSKPDLPALWISIFRAKDARGLQRPGWEVYEVGSQKRQSGCQDNREQGCF